MSNLIVEKTIDKQTAILKDKFEIALEKLEQAKPFAKSMYQTEVFQLATELAGSFDGLSVIYSHAHRFDETGVFYAGLWEDITKMEPSLVGGSLRDKGINSIVELLSEMRMLSIAKGDYVHPVVSKEEAGAFLNEVLALNLDLLFPSKTETYRTKLDDHVFRAQRLFYYLGQELSLNAIAAKIVLEIERLTVQRPITTGRILKMINMSRQLIDSGIDEQTAEALEKYACAVNGPTPLSQDVSNQREYRLRLEKAHEDEIEIEARSFAEAINDTGLVSPYHAVLIRFLNRKDSDNIPKSLDLSEAGTESFKANRQLIHDVIQISIYPETCQAIYGLKRLLEREVLAQEQVVPAIRRLFELPIHAQARQVLFRPEHKQSGISLNGLLVAGVISVLGQPLGVGQGLQATCQSARAISLWSQYGIVQLLDYIASAARDNNISMIFEGEAIQSSLLEGGVSTDFQQDVDPVSSLLVPHLDKIYNEMMKRTLLRGEDGHKWVNPEFYGGWIPTGFINVINQATLKVTDYPAFVKLFYATHHPDYNEGRELVYPNPVGIFITNVHGELLGLHAVTIQRINQDQNGGYRVYFYNPNNDSGQNWGQDIKATVTGFGELEGESSLPFHEFVSRMYAFHYNLFQQGDIYMVEDSLVAQVEALAKESWGKNYVWA